MTPTDGRPGSTLDDRLAEAGILEEATEQAVESVVAWQIRKATRASNFSEAPSQNPAETEK